MKPWKSIALALFAIGAVVGSNVMAYRAGHTVAETRCNLASIHQTITEMRLSVAERRAEIARWQAQVEDRP